MDDTYVYWAPQYWYTDYIVDYRAVASVGSQGYPFFFGRIDYDSPNSQIKYRSYVYSSDYNVEHDICTTTTWTHSIPAGDQYFLYGTETSNGHLYKYLQAGVESNNVISECSWKIRDGHVSAWISSSWYHYAGKNTRGVNAWISRTGTGTDEVAVGPDTYTNCDLYTSGTPSVTYQKGTSTLAEGTSLWTGVGTTIPTVQTPFN